MPTRKSHHHQQGHHAKPLLFTADKPGQTRPAAVDVRDGATPCASSQRCALHLMTRWRTAARHIAQRMVWSALVGVLATGLSLLLIVKLLLASQAGEWRMPWRIGPARFELSVPTLIRPTTSP